MTHDLHRESAKLNDRQRRLQARKREYVNERKRRPCARCGGEFPPVCMDMHHRDQSTKLHNVADSHRIAWPVLIAEVEKCDVICANCHRIIDHEATGRRLPNENQLGFEVGA